MRKIILRSRTMLVAVAVALLCGTVLWFVWPSRSSTSHGFRFGGQLHYWYDSLRGKQRTSRELAKWARDAIESGKGYELHFHDLAKWEYEYGSTEEAKALLEKGMSHPSAHRNSTCYRLLAEILISEGKSEQAIAKRPAWMDEGSFFYRFIAGLEVNAGHFDSAREHLRLAVKKCKTDLAEQEESLITWIAVCRRHISAAETSPSVRAEWQKDLEDTQRWLPYTREWHAKTVREIQAQLDALPKGRQ